MTSKCLHFFSFCLSSDDIGTTDTLAFVRLLVQLLSHNNNKNDKREVLEVIENVVRRGMSCVVVVSTIHIAVC